MMSPFPELLLAAIFNHLFATHVTQPMPPTGDYRGEFTSELKPGITSSSLLAVAGPRNYGYGKVECKERGFTLDTRGQTQLNFYCLEANVIDEVTEPLEEPRATPVHNPLKIKIEETKRCNVGFDKRVVVPNTFPYGYTRTDLDNLDTGNTDILLGL